MKKIMLTMLAATAVFCLHAQNNQFYLKATGGFSFSTAKTEHPGIESYTVLNPQTMEPISITENGLYGSYGGGAKGGLALGYKFNKIVGVELGVNYFQSGNQLREKTSVTFDGAPGTFLLEQKAYARALAVIPSLVMTTGNEQGPSPYARFSFVVPVWGDLIISTDIQDSFGRVNPQLAGQPAVYDREDKIDPVKPQIGFEGAMGVLFPINEKLSFFAEAEFRTLTVDGNTRETTKFTVSVGSEQLQTLDDFPVGVTQGIFHESLNNNMNVKEFENGSENPNFNPNQAADELKPFANINGFGFNFGLRINI